MGLLRRVGSLKIQVSFAEYSLFYRALLQKRPKNFRSLLIVAPHTISEFKFGGDFLVLNGLKRKGHGAGFLLQCVAVRCRVLQLQVVAVCCKHEGQE